MNEIMTYEEIKQQFDSEWILVGDHETTENFELIRGRVLWHSKDRDEVYDKAIELQPKRAAFLYTGKIPKGSAVVI